MSCLTKGKNENDNNVLNRLKWLKNKGFEICKYEKNNIEYSAITSHAATVNSSLLVMKWLKKEGAGVDTMTFVKSVGVQNLETLKWIFSLNIYPDTEVFSSAVNGDVLSIKWLLSIGCPIDKDVYYPFGMKEKPYNDDMREFLIQLAEENNIDIDSYRNCFVKL